MALSKPFFGLTCKRTVTYTTLGSHSWLIKVTSVGFLIHKEVTVLKVKTKILVRQINWVARHHTSMKKALLKKP